MEQVYKKHFGLFEAPFNITPDPSFLYLTETHREGLAQLTYGINARRGFIVLTGEVGTGKTTLIQSLLQQLPDGTQTAMIFSVITTPLDLLRYICEEFKLASPLGEVKELHDYNCLLDEFLLQTYRDHRNAALIIDEAQNLSTEVLESIRLLSNFETTKDKLLQIVLVGQPELTEKLNSPELRQLRQRVTLRHQLRPFSIDECQEYISNRLKHAGGDPEIFPPKTVAIIHQYSSGIPRLINVICDNAMINAYALGRRIIEPILIQEVADDLCLTMAASRVATFRRENSVRVEPRASGRMELVKAQPLPITNDTSIGGAVAAHYPIATRHGETVPASFLIFVREALIDAMGPMGRVVLLEQVKHLGGSIERFPREKIRPLLDSVSREICDEFLRERFRQSVSEELRTVNNG